MLKYTLVRKKSGCPNCDRLGEMLNERKIVVPHVFAEDHMDFCREHYIRMVPCLLVHQENREFEKLIFNVEEIVKELESDNG